MDRLTLSRAWTTIQVEFWFYPIIMILSKKLEIPKMLESKFVYLNFIQNTAQDVTEFPDNFACQKRTVKRSVNSSVDVEQCTEWELL